MSCHIQLTNFFRPYFPGNHIIGKVICNFDSPEDIRGVSVKLKGVERVYWRQNRTTYVAKNKFLAEEIPLATTECVLPGLREYPFMFTLPLDLPTSYAGRHGWVTYTLKSKVDRPLKFNYKFKIKLPVISPIDQNRLVDKTLLRPGFYQSEKTFCCLCCARGGLVMEVNLDKKTFVPGEMIRVRVKVINNSSHGVKRVKAKYWVCVTSSVRTLLSKESTFVRGTLAKGQQDGLGSGEEKSYEFLLQLPRLKAVPNFLNSQILTFTSGIQITAVLPAFHCNMRMIVPAVLADIPVGGQQEYYARMDRMGAHLVGKGLTTNNQFPVGLMES